ncbi:hypothetical protein HKD37_14G040530 [Glycine soja]
MVLIYDKCDENPKTVQIQGPMTKSRTKQSMDTLQQMVAGILSKAQVEKDKSPNGEGRRPKKVKAQVEKDEGLSGEGRKTQVEKHEGPKAKALSFSLDSLLNQYQTYQGNPCGVYPDLSSFIGSGVYPNLSSLSGSGIIQISVACIKRSARSQDHIIWFVFCPCFVIYTYQGNPCGVYPDLSSFTGSGVYPDLSSLFRSGVIQISVACIKRSAPNQDHIKM